MSPITPIDLERKTEQISILIYGYTGSGKTHLAGTAPDNLFLDFETGTATLLNIGLDDKGQKVGPPFSGKAFHIDTARELKQVIAPLSDPESAKQMVEKLGFQPKTITIDTLTRMQHHTMLDIIDRREIKAGRHEDVMEIREWGQLLIQAYRLMKILPNQGYNIIALAQRRETEDPETKVTKFMPNLSGQWGDQIGAYFDIEAYQELREVEIGGVRKVVHRLHFQPSGSWVAKCRYKGLKPYYDDITFPELHKLILEARGIKKGGDA